MFENDVYFEPDADWCWYCDRNQPEDNVRVFLCSAGHSPYNAEANYICEDHLDSDAVKYVRDTDASWESFVRELDEVDSHHD